MPFRILAGSALVLFLMSASLPTPTAAAGQQPPQELPPGKGREILESSCTSCHELEEVLKYRGKYSRDEWRMVVKTMIDYGAPVDAKDLEVLVEYLDQHLGKRQ